MAHIIADRVKETTTTTGTSDFTLGGAVTGFVSFSSGIGNSNTTEYCAESGSEWEVGIGTVSSGTLTRDTIIASSNSGAKVVFSAGTKNVFCTASAGRIPDLRNDNAFNGDIEALSFTGAQDQDLIIGVKANTVGNGNSIEVIGGTSSGVGANGGTISFTGGYSDSGAAGNVEFYAGETDTGTPGWIAFYGTTNVISDSIKLESSDSTSRLEILHGADYTQLTVSDTNYSTIHQSRLAVGGISDLSYHVIGFYNGTTFYEGLRVVPGATITGEQNRITIRSANNGSHPALVAEGGSTNINLDLLAKGTGTIRLGSSSCTVTSAGAVTATSFTGSGSGLTSLNGSNISSGTVAVARLGSGTPSSSNYLRGDGTWSSLPSIDSVPTDGSNNAVSSNGVFDALALKADASAMSVISSNAQTGTSYTLVLGDAGKMVTMSNSSANTLTVPPNSTAAFAVGTIIQVMQLGSGITTIAAGSGVTVNKSSLQTLAVNGQYAVACLIKTATNTWVAYGNLAAA